MTRTPEEEVARRARIPRNYPGVRPAPEGWADPIAAYSAWLKLQDMSPSTIEIRHYHLRRLGRQTGKPPFQITLDDLITWVGGQAWGNETSRSMRSTLRSFYGWAVSTGRLEASPAERFPQTRVGERSPKPVPEDDYTAALAAAPTPQVRLMLRLAGELGLRRAEVAQVHRDHLTATPDGHLLTVLGKGRKTRVLPVPPGLAADIIAHTNGVDGYAFPSPEGGHLTPHWVGTLVTRTLPDGYSMHKLRHRALTRAYQNSKDILLVSKLAGHSSVATTAGFYVAPDMSGLRSLVEGIGS